ncbi:MAG: hypothetical protein L0027_01385 [Candidatus Rokubacteria bacterium]|nr:hypothetical protein [Candidatus Rokubacteria bacterium]
MTAPGGAAGVRSGVRILASMAALATMCLAEGRPASAQAAPTTAGWYATPSFAVSEVFDDNVFGTSTDRRWDLITRFSPGLSVGYRSAPLTIELAGGFDSEVHAIETELDQVFAQWQVGLNLQYLPTRRATVSLAASFLETQDANVLTEGTTGQQQGRQTARQWLASPAFQYQFTPTTVGRIGYSFNRGELQDGDENTTHSAFLSVFHDVSPTDTLSATYRFEYFDNRFADGGSETFTSNVLLPGWIHRFGPADVLSVQLGARITDPGKVTPEAAINYSHRWQLVRLDFAYVHTETTVVGDQGLQRVDALSGALVWDITREFQGTFGASYNRSNSGPDRSTTNVYGLTGGLVYQINRWLSARAAYSLTYQDERGNYIFRNILSVGLAVAYPYRID